MLEVLMALWPQIMLYDCACDYKSTIYLPEMTIFNMNNGYPLTNLIGVEKVKFVPVILLKIK